LSPLVTCTTFEPVSGSTVKICARPLTMRTKAIRLPSGLKVGSCPSPSSVMSPEPSRFVMPRCQTPRMKVPKTIFLPSGEMLGSETKGEDSPLTTIETAAFGLFETVRTRLHVPVEFEL
jgi:hypothetical protein